MPRFVQSINYWGWKSTRSCVACNWNNRDRGNETQRSSLAVVLFVNKIIHAANWIQAALNDKPVAFVFAATFVIGASAAFVAAERLVRGIVEVHAQG